MIIIIINILILLWKFTSVFKTITVYNLVELLKKVSVLFFHLKFIYFSQWSLDHEKAFFNNGHTI